MATASDRFDEMDVTLLPSLLCNLRCTFCFQERFDHDVHLDTQMLLDKLHGVFSRTRFLVLLGGEPTIIPGLKEFFRTLTQRYRQINIELVTNGTALDDEWIDLCVGSKTKLTISLNASNPQTYARLVRRSGAAEFWRKAYTNFTKLAKRSRQCGLEAPRPTISMMVNDTSAEDMPAFVHLACRLGADCKLIYDCRGPDFQQGPAVQASYAVAGQLKELFRGEMPIHVINAPAAEPTLTAEYWSDTARQAELSDKRTALMAEFSGEPLPLGYSLDPDSPPAVADEIVSVTDRPHRRRNEDVPFGAEPMTIDGREVCRAPWRGVLVMNDGSVLFCERHTRYVLGNLNTQSLDEIYSGLRARQIRRRIREGDYRYCDPHCPANLNPASSHTGQIGAGSLSEEWFHQGHYEKALPHYEAYVGGPGDLDATAVYRLAFCCQATGRSAEALATYNRSMELGFDEFWVRYNRGSLYMNLGRSREAIEDLARAVALDPDHQGVQTVLQQAIAR